MMMTTTMMVIIISCGSLTYPCSESRLDGQVVLSVLPSSNRHIYVIPCFINSVITLVCKMCHYITICYNLRTKSVINRCTKNRLSHYLFTSTSVTLLVVWMQSHVYLGCFPFFVRCSVIGVRRSESEIEGVILLCILQETDLLYWYRYRFYSCTPSSHDMTLTLTSVLLCRRQGRQRRGRAGLGQRQGAAPLGPGHGDQSPRQQHQRRPDRQRQQPRGLLHHLLQHGLGGRQQWLREPRRVRLAGLLQHQRLLHRQRVSIRRA